MDYDDNFESLDELLNAINEALQEKVEMGITVISGHCNRDMFDKDESEFEDFDSIMNALDEELDKLGSPLPFAILH